MPPTLPSGEIHVWRAALDLPLAQVETLRQCLTEDELDRAQRYRFETDRRHFVVARGLLRTLLGLYLGIHPSAVRLCYGPAGKPALIAEPGEQDLRFNVSHSHGVALYAVAPAGEVGVDLERIRPELAAGRMAERLFSPREVAAIRALPSEQQTAGFFACWTRKEAYIKAVGAGLSLPFKDFDVSVAPAGPASLLAVRHDPGAAARWSMWNLSPGDGYAAALAGAGSGWQLRCWRWTDALFPHLC
jgi:4'-phosphopantetheinyl transferase